ncbi:type II toxin-antitoxin system RatA family toxin [Actinocorallia populi]|uniref:type II toxin-antitoxin system RatA family toxin n=1 Tax=Actinocorallia populi TaxID=2079200 RepID=UPI000D08B4CF|nr:SRPBCC family protein [Actinocorallia populi]
MKHFMLRTLVPDLAPDDVFARVSAFEAFTEHTDVIRRLEVKRDADGRQTSFWEVRFYEGIMRWTQLDAPGPGSRSLAFEQLEGDLDSFHGSWRVEPAAAGSLVVFESAFDLGMPSVAELLDPIAIEAFENTMTAIMRGLFGSGAAFTILVDGREQAEAVR